MRSTNSIERTYSLIRKIERELCDQLIGGLKQSPFVRIIQTNPAEDGLSVRTDSIIHRLPVVSFYHKKLNSQFIESACSNAGFKCRCGTFLSTDLLLEMHGVDSIGSGPVRFSLTHYNTESEVQRLLDLLRALPGW